MGRQWERREELNRAYDEELGGMGVPPVYVEAITRDCTVCSAKMGELCIDEKTGGPRKRPHGSRMVTRIGWSD